MTFQDAGNAMNPAEIADLSATVDIPAFLAYRLAVGRRTRASSTPYRPLCLILRVHRLNLRGVLFGDHFALNLECWRQFTRFLCKRVRQQRKCLHLFITG